MNIDRALEIVPEFRRQRVAVLGDLMLDRYIWGKASRISQEAPVPIVEVIKTTCAPGGAANVLRNLASLGAQAAAFGLVGDDAAAHELTHLLAEQYIDTTGILRDRDRVTTEKTRIIADHQQVVRVDTERIEPIDHRHESQLIEQLAAEIEADAVQAIIIEDYAKGTVGDTILRDVSALCGQRDIPLALDPHPGNPVDIEGVTIMTPNRAEAFALAGVYYKPPRLPIYEDTGLLEVVEILQDRWEPRYLLVTLGADGMALFQEDEAPLHITTQAREVYDVSGAGDTVIASFVLAVLSGATPEEAVHIANHAAGIVVGKVGTAPVTADELLGSFRFEEVG